MNNQQAVNHEQNIPDVLQSLASIHSVIDAYELDRTLYHLILLRASQINQCHYCIDMHIREAREDGESDTRLASLQHWREQDIFSDKEKAAFAWVEALTVLDASSELGLLRGKLRTFFSEQEISLLTVNIAMINLWNRLKVSGH